MVKAILATLFCCLPLGVVAIVHAAQVTGRLDAGDFQGAYQLSKQADDWGNYSIIASLIVIVPYVLLVLVSVG